MQINWVLQRQFNIIIYVLNLTQWQIQDLTLGGGVHFVNGWGVENQKKC